MARPSIARALRRIAVVFNLVMLLATVLIVAMLFCGSAREPLRISGRRGSRGYLLRTRGRRSRPTHRGGSGAVGGRKPRACVLVAPLTTWPSSVSGLRSSGQSRHGHMPNVRERLVGVRDGQPLNGRPVPN